jgi:hypothetical protein
VNQWINAELTIVWSLKHKNTQPSYIFNRKNPQNSETQNGPRRGLDFIALVRGFSWPRITSRLLEYNSVESTLTIFGQTIVLSAQFLICNLNIKLALLYSVCSDSSAAWLLQNQSNVRIANCFKSLKVTKLQSLIWYSLKKGNIYIVCGASLGMG